jgi:hypothetical protein
VIRGGSWDYTSVVLRSAARNEFTSDNRNYEAYVSRGSLLPEPLCPYVLGQCDLGRRLWILVAAKERRTIAGIKQADEFGITAGGQEFYL